MLPIYPTAPTNIVADKLQPSIAFKKQVVTVLFSIVSFFVVYVLLILAAICLSIACLYGAGMAIAFHPSFLTLSIGIGLLALAVSVLVFLIKFIFSVSKNDKASRIEITAAEQPMLFEFIQQITIETKTPFPKKIFLSPDVNACVFYNSSFWSMILPIRKNLEIGLGLVNSVNISEFKAIMAHEFGHFSQQSMKLGSFTYNVNKIIYNMLFENTGYSNFLNTWASAGNVLSLFASITAGIAQGIQSILKEMYKVVNKNYMGLSREMEFHADAIAASVSGGNNLVTALARIEVAAGCYQTVLDKADDWLKEKKKTTNVFSNQLSVFQHLAKNNNLPIANGIPTVSTQFIESFSASRINYKDQWASHPSFTDRKQHLETLDMNVPADDTSAWVLFENADVLQKQVTDNLYKAIPLENEILTEIDNSTFEEQYLDELKRYELPAIYKGYYDNRFIALEDWKIEALSNETTNENFETIFTEEHGKLQTTINALTKDIAIVEAIKSKELDIQTFDFDGVKYSVTDVETVLEKLQTELTELKEKQSQLDKAAYLFFYHQPNMSGIKFRYIDLQKYSDNYQVYIKICESIYNTISPLYQNNNSIEFVVAAVSTLVSNFEPKFKTIIKEHIASWNATEVEMQRIQAFVDSKYGYFVDNHFKNNELEELNYIIKTCNNLFYNQKFSLYKKLLTEQLTSIAIA